MPFIKTDKKRIYYFLKPLYAGIKPINKEIASDNLSIFDQIANNNNLPYLLVFGTALGAVREKDFISHDEDIDLGISIGSQSLFFSVLNDLKKNGFKIVRWDRRGLMSIMRKGEYIDIYIFKPLLEHIWHCCGEPILQNHLFDVTQIEFKGKKINIPADIDEYLKFCYGDEWNKPLAFFSFSKISLIKKVVLFVKELVKAYLPDKVFFYMTKSREIEILGKYVQRGKINLG